MNVSKKRFLSTFMSPISPASRARRVSCLFLLLSLFALAGCFGGVKNRGKVKDYESGKVITKKGYYHVGALPATWQRQKTKKAIIAFQNQALGAAISTDAFCDQAYNDSSLKSLTQHLFGGIEDLKVEEASEFLLDERAARYSKLSGKMDGVPVHIGIVVIKKDWCLFDFFLVAPPENYERAYDDFLPFYEGFRFDGDVLE